MRVKGKAAIVDKIDIATAMILIQGEEYELLGIQKVWS